MIGLLLCLHAHTRIVRYLMEGVWTKVRVSLRPHDVLRLRWLAATHLWWDCRIGGGIGGGCVVTVFVVVASSSLSLFVDVVVCD